MSEMTYEPLMVEPAGVPRGRAMVERADWAARAYAKYDVATVNRIVDAAASERSVALLAELLRLTGANEATLRDELDPRSFSPASQRLEKRRDG